ncbi:MAG TPA: histidine kinase dimerization/phospho-acceptor domain-containing protein [Gaiellaceae bacterium]|nr:histidine kinase dimerization/phospho-acceptor domain-containing protein [Gaiellaceae bacterium]
MQDERFAELVGLACHDVRTPLATIGGFAKTLVRSGQLPERESRYIGMIDEAAEQIHELVDELSLATRLTTGSYTSILTDEDTLELASSTAGERVAVDGTGVSLETDRALLTRALAALAAAALRFGQVEAVAWSVEGRDLRLSPVADDAAPILDGSSPRDLGALLARIAIESLGGTVELDGESLRVSI